MLNVAVYFSPLVVDRPIIIYYKKYIKRKRDTHFSLLKQQTPNSNSYAPKIFTFNSVCQKHQQLLKQGQRYGELILALL